MSSSILKLSARVSLAIPLYFASLATAEASPYTATYIGDPSDLTVSSTIDNSKTGLSYAFESTTRSLTDLERQNLPEVTVLQGATYPQPITVPMQATAINDSGTVIGSVPAGGGSLSDPWMRVSMVYTVRSADGHYSPMVELSPADSPGRGWLALSQANQILIQDSQGGRLLDLASGITTPLMDLVPQALRDLYYGFHADGIDDRGDILVSGRPKTGDLMGFHSYILTPPGLTPPPAVPEPATVWLFGAVASAFGIRTLAGRGRKAK